MEEKDLLEMPIEIINPPERRQTNLHLMHKKFCVRCYRLFIREEL